MNGFVLSTSMLTSSMICLKDVVGDVLDSVVDNGVDDVFGDVTDDVVMLSIALSMTSLILIRCHLIGRVAAEWI